MFKLLINRLIFKIKNKSCVLGRNVVISNNTKVGKGCKIAHNSNITATVSLGNNVKIGEDCRLNNLNVDDNSFFESGVKILGSKKGKIIIGKECYVGVNNIFDTSDDIVIGDYVHIAGPSTALWCHSSAEMCINGITLNSNNRDKYRPTAPIGIESNVYIGGNCTIYPGVIIGDHSIVTPNSVVTKSFPPYSFIGGVPAIKIKSIAKKAL